MKVLVTDKSAEEALQLLKDAGHEVIYDEKYCFEKIDLKPGASRHSNFGDPAFGQ